MSGLLLLLSLALAGGLGWFALKSFEEREAELIAKYTQLKRKHGLH